MEEALEHFLSQTHWTVLLAVIVVSLGVLAKAADWLVDEAVALSESLRIMPVTEAGATDSFPAKTAVEARPSRPPTS